jgi:hypothetical protein
MGALAIALLAYLRGELGFENRQQQVVAMIIIMVGVHEVLVHTKTSGGLFGAHFSSHITNFRVCVWSRKRSLDILEIIIQIDSDLSYI